MNDDPQRPVVLTQTANEVQAAMIVAALDAAGIRAEATGGLTSEFIAAAPGGVQVLVRAEDVERAQDVLDALETRD